MPGNDDAFDGEASSMRLPVCIGIALALSGCTTELVVSKLSDDTRGPITGFTYTLPFTQFEMTAVRTLTKCDDTTTPGDITLNYDYSLTSPTAASLPDSAQTYVIDYRSLASGSKISDLKLQNFATGMLQQINASAEDRTAQIVTNTITGVGNIAASIASGGYGASASVVSAQFLGTPPVKPAPLVDTPHCNEKATKAIKKQKELDKVLKGKTTQLNASVAELKTLTAAAAAMGTRIDASIQRDLLVHARKVASDSQAVTHASELATDNQKLYTSTFTFRFPLSGKPSEPGVFQQVIIPGGQAAYKAWIKCTDRVKNEEIDCPVQPNETFFVASVQIQPIYQADVLPYGSGAAGWPDPQPDSPGLRYRIPARGHLVLCAAPAATTPSEEPGLDPCTNSMDPRPWLPAAAKVIWEGPVAQLGRLQFMPYKNGPFQNNLLAATFNQDGSLASAEYQAKTSSLETATNAFAQASAATAQAIKAVQTGPTTKLNAQTAQLNAQTAKEKAQNELLAANAASTVAEQTALLAANKALLDAFTAQAASQLALKDAQAELQKP
jgi:hypothetical protein